MKKEKLTTRDIALMAMYIAFAIVLEYVGNYIPFLQMPNGGSIGLNTIALLVASYHLGWKKGLLVSIVGVLGGMIVNAPHIAGIAGLLLDYLIAFGIYGIAVLFPNFGYFYSGILVTNFARFVCHTLAGVIIWETPLWGSIVYNAPYMIATCIVDLIFVPLLMKAISKKTKKAN